jgi:hypothetical protein
MAIALKLRGYLGRHGAVNALGWAWGRPGVELEVPPGVLAFVSIWEAS